MGSCEKENTPVMDHGRVRFISGITATPTRVAIDPQGESVWEQGTPVGIYMVENGTDVVAGNVANIKYTASTAGVSTAFAPAANPIYYPTDEAATVDFIAYHPHKDVVSGFTYPIDVSDQTTLYAQVYARRLFAHMGHTSMQGHSPNTLDYKLLDYYQMQQVKGNNPLHPVADEFEIVIRHTLGIDEPAELKQTHIRILDEMEKTFAEYSLTALPNGEPSIRLPAYDVRLLVEKINKYSLEMQKEVKKVLGDEAFIRLNGDKKFYLPVNPEIALNILGE